MQSKFFTLALFGLTKANFDSDDSENFLNTLGQLIEENGELDRNLQPSQNVPLSANFENIDNYGCYCNFQTNFSNGKGPFQDHIDQFCKKVQDGYFCASFDDPTCDASQVSYNYPNPGTVLLYVLAPTSANMDAVMADCVSENPNNSCAQTACQIENYFIASVTSDITLGNIDSNLQVDNGFDKTSTCVVNRVPSDGPGGDGREFPRRTECCGPVPHRFAYKHVDGRRECCGMHTFDAMLMQCCDDGTTSAMCPP